MHGDGRTTTVDSVRTVVFPQPPRRHVDILRRVTERSRPRQRGHSFLSFWNTLEHQYIKPALRRLWPWRKRTFAGVRVHYMKHLDGGGGEFGQEYIAYLKGRGMPPQQRVFE